jgi:zinc protease
MSLAFVRAACALGCAVWLGVGAWGRAAAPEIPIPDIPYTQFVLKNGLTLLVHEDHKLPVVAVNTWYHVGSKNEVPGKTGFAHLFEHLMFSGSENFNHTYLSAMGRVGATDMNGTTSTDRTNYFQNVPASMLDYALFAESDRMGHLLGVLDQKKLDLQRGVVQNEKRQGENQPYGVTRQLLTENTYPTGHPYSWTTIGSMKDLDAASMDDVREWFKTYYGPNNVTLVLAGDITPEEARAKVEKYYGDIPPGPPLARHEAWIAKRTGTHRGTVQDRVPQARIYRVWNVPGVHTPDEAPLDLGAHVLGGGKTSRLYKRLVYRDQLATDASSQNSSREIAGLFQMVLTARPGGDVHRAEQAADEELRRFLQSGPTDQELRLAKTAILAAYARMGERIGGFGGKSDLLASCMTYTGKPDCYKEYLRNVKAATPATVRAAMARWLSDGDYVLEVQPYPTVSATGVGAERNKEPAEGKAAVLNLPAMQKATLSNGLKVVVAERHTAPVVNLSLLVNGGNASDPQDATGLAGFALRLLEEGSRTRSAAKVSEELESLGATFGAGANLDASFVSMNALKPTLPQALDVYADLVLHPAFAPGDLERIRRDRLAAIQREQSNPQAVALRVLPALLYGKGHAYARPISGIGTASAIEHVARADLVKFHDTWFRPNNATLMIVGDVTLKEVVPLLEKAFAGWKAAAVPAVDIARVAPREKPVFYLMDRPGALQSVIVGGQLTAVAGVQDLVRLQTVNAIFGGNFSSRINMNLREDKHWSYGVRSEIIPAVGQRMFMSRSPVQTDKTREALQELMKEYAGVAGAKPIAAGELAEAQSKEVLGLPGKFETADQLTSAYATIIEYRLPEDYYSRYTPTVMGMTPAEASALAAKTIEPGRMVWVIVGDLGKIEAGIRGLDLGEVHRIDADGKILP